MTAVIIVMEGTSALSIRNEWSSISSYFNINKRAKVMLSFIRDTDLIMQTQNDRHIILLLYSLLEHQCVVDNIKIHPTPSLLYLHMMCHSSYPHFQWIEKL